MTVGNRVRWKLGEGYTGTITQIKGVEGETPHLYLDSHPYYVRWEELGNAGCWVAENEVELIKSGIDKVLDEL